MVSVSLCLSKRALYFDSVCACVHVFWIQQNKYVTLSTFVLDIQAPQATMTAAVIGEDCGTQVWISVLVLPPTVGNNWTSVVAKMRRVNFVRNQRCTCCANKCNKHFAMFDFDYTAALSVIQHPVLSTQCQQVQWHPKLSDPLPSPTLATSGAMVARSFGNQPPDASLAQHASFLEDQYMGTLARSGLDSQSAQFLSFFPKYQGQ